MQNNSKITSITSTTNDLVKFCTKLTEAKLRKKEKLIFLDGEKTLTGLVEDGFEFEYIFLKEDNILLNQIKSKNLAKNIVLADDKVLKKISTTKSPCSIAGIIKEPEINQNSFLNLNKIALIDGIKDPGNLGTIIRSACAFSIDGIILFNECVDLYNTKVIRACAQNMFKIPIIQTSDLNFIKKLKENHKLVSTVVDGENDLFKYNFCDKFILAFGSEARGLSSEIIKLSDDKITMPMDNNVESINLAVCASITFAIIKQTIKN